MIIWLTGNSGSGKSTLGRILRKKLNGILLDGDEMRYAISEKAGFSKEDREEHNLRCARLAKILDSQDFNIIISIIAPFQETRDKIDNIIKPIWIYIKRNKDSLKYKDKDKDKPYEVPENPDIIVDTDKLAIDESIELILRELNIE